MKIKVKEITLTLAEGPTHLTDKPITVHSWIDAMTALLVWKIKLFPDSKRIGGYYKTDFVVTFENGNTYSGRFDIAGDEPCCLASHVWRSVSFLSGRRKRPDMTDERYLAHLDQIDPTGEHRKGATEILDNYDLDNYDLFGLNEEPENVTT